MNRTFCAVFIILLLTLPVNASDLQGAINSFTSDIPSLPQGLGKALSANIVHVQDGSMLSSVSTSGNIYSLAVIPVRADSDSEISAELDLHMKNIALMKARRHLALIIGQGGVDRKLFRYDDALGNALLMYYQAEISGRSIKGIQTAGDTSGGYVFGLAWLDSRTVNTLSENVPERGILDDEYCRFLYRQHAERLFSAGKYSEALPVFRNIHDFRWSDVDAYLDASECFLRTGQPDECVKLLRELRAELGSKMSSRNLQRAGKLFRECGDKHAAAESLREARKRLHEEQRKGN